MLIRATAAVLFVCLTSAIAVQAQDDAPPDPLVGRQVMPLWSDAVPGATGTTKGDVPQLILTRVDSETATAGVVILPGGGYHMRAIGHEGFQIADWFADMGIPSVICTYRVRGEGNGDDGYGHPYPMMDAQRALQTVRERASEWNIDADRIGVIGFSAGGHLASTVSTHFADTESGISSRPDFSILCYPVIALNADHTHKGSQKNLLGENADAALVESLSNEKQVTKDTPPTFLFHTGEDTVVPVRNSLVYYQACVDAGVPAELHVFPKGRHGVGLAAGFDGADQWPSLCRAWLTRRGMVVKGSAR